MVPSSGETRLPVARKQAGAVHCNLSPIDLEPLTSALANPLRVQAPLAAPLLQLPLEVQPGALQMFRAISRYITCVQLARATLPATEKVPQTTLVEVVGEIVGLCQEQPLLRDELYAQLHKQTRNCPTR